ncbi:MAG: UvrD-helicase domain-containing protein, partial [Prolixibacteraceae bacterium]|nr:UvrD-helicase domain-containing protein [Prolixibacteraceae bacterium]
TGDTEKYQGTIDLFPQEGKYYYDGHRKCNVCWNPAETLRHNYICPVCKKPVTVGVMNRIIQLSDREDITERPNRMPYRSIIPLKEILSEITGSGVNSKKVEDEYMHLLKRLGPEMEILLDIPEEIIESGSSPVFTEAIRRMRNRQVVIEEGYDGQYGVIKVFRPGEIKSFEPTGSLFQIEKQAPPEKKDLINFDLKGIRYLSGKKAGVENSAAEKNQVYNSQEPPKKTIYDLNPHQAEAVKNLNGPSLIIAGPGTGKTKTLTTKIACYWKNLLQRHLKYLQLPLPIKPQANLRTGLRYF